MRIREIASGLEFPEGPVAMDDGSVLLVEIARGTLTRVTPDGRASVVATLGGGPNGAAIGPDGAVYVCNNGGFHWHRRPDGQLRPGHQGDDYSGGRIERVNLATGKAERVYDSCDGEALRGPNDLVFDEHGNFYFSDLGKGRARELDRGAIHYAKPDGSSIRTVAPGVMTPNGVGLSPDGKTLYYAETEGARLWALDLAEPGVVDRRKPPAPPGVRVLAASPGGHHQYFDSMAVDALGNLCVATILQGGITVISPDGGLVSHVPAPDRYTTNICFGGTDMRTAYLTLSGSGRLVAIDDWPVPGLRLHCNA